MKSDIRENRSRQARSAFPASRSPSPSLQRTASDIVSQSHRISVCYTNCAITLFSSLFGELRAKRPGPLDLQAKSLPAHRFDSIHLPLASSISDLQRVVSASVGPAEARCCIQALHAAACALLCNESQRHTLQQSRLILRLPCARPSRQRPADPN